MRSSFEFEYVEQQMHVARVQRPTAVLPVWNWDFQIPFETPVRARCENIFGSETLKIVSVTAGHGAQILRPGIHRNQGTRHSAGVKSMPAPASSAKGNLREKRRRYAPLLNTS